MGVCLIQTVLQVSLPEVYDKTAEVNRLTVLQLLFVEIRLCQTIHGKKHMHGQQSLDRVLSCMSACKTFFIVLLLDLVKELYSRIAAQNQMNCKGSNHLYNTPRRRCVSDPQHPFQQRSTTIDPPNGGVF